MTWEKLQMYFKKLIIVLIALVIVSCEDDSGGGPDTNIDKQALLSNYADNIIIPAYEELNTDINELETSFSALKEEVNENNISDIRQKFIDAYTTWQKCTPFEFGPAEEVILRQSINTFPLDTVTVKDVISSGEYDLTLPQYSDAKGFPALDYVLFNVSQGEEMEHFQNENRLNFIGDVIAQIAEKVSYANNEWENYKQKFISRDGTDVGSSLSQLINQLNFDYELIKRIKVGVPAGKFSTQVLPYNVEAPYSQISNDLIRENLSAIELLITGPEQNDPQKTDNIKEYLDKLGATRGDKLLSDAILDEFIESFGLLEQINAPLFEAVTTEEQKVDALYENLQKTVVLLKTDMTSEMGIKINYQDNDGD